jgi:hypothetical protein
MRKKSGVLLVFSWLLAWSSPGEASGAGCEYILYPHVSFSYCTNHCRRNDMSVLYYTGLMEAVNAYVARKQDEGALQNKKLRIQFIDPLADSGRPEIELTRSRWEYQIVSRDAANLNLRDLVRLVDYFASPNWQSFCCYDYVNRSHESVRNKIGRILDREVGQPDLAFFDGRRSIVAEIGDLQVVYENDRLFYSLAGQRLDLVPADPTPVQVKNRYLLGSRDFIHVYEEGREVRHSRTVQDSEGSWCEPPLRARAYRSWVNVGCWEPRRSYSYEKNRFYELAPFVPTRENLNVPHGEFGRPNCSDVGDGEVHPPALRVIQEPGK